MKGKVLVSQSHLSHCILFSRLTFKYHCIMHSAVTKCAATTPNWMTWLVSCFSRVSTVHLLQKVSHRKRPNTLRGLLYWLLSSWSKQCHYISCLCYCLSQVHPDTFWNYCTFIKVREAIPWFTFTPSMQGCGAQFVYFMKNNTNNKWPMVYCTKC